MPVQLDTFVEDTNNNVLYMYLTVQSLMFIVATLMLSDSYNRNNEYYYDDDDGIIIF